MVAPSKHQHNFLHVRVVHRSGLYCNYNNAEFVDILMLLQSTNFTYKIPSSISILSTRLY
jgi:hypothetical protein